MFENTLYYWLNHIKDLILSILAGIIPKLPSAISMPLEFIGVTKYLDESLKKYQNFEEEKKKKEKEYIEYAKQIEKNRPISPKKVDGKLVFESPKIDLS